MNPTSLAQYGCVSRAAPCALTRAGYAVRLLRLLIDTVPMEVRFTELISVNRQA